MRINESMKVIDMLWERREHLRNEGEAGLRAAENWSAYASEGALRADTVVLIAEPPAYAEATGEAVLPLRAQGMKLTATAETVDNVMISAVNQNGAVSAETLAEALIYHLASGDFLKISGSTE